MANPNIDAVNRFLEAIKTWDFDTMRELMHPTDFRYSLPYRPEWVPAGFEGRDEMLGFTKQWSEMMDGFEKLSDISIYAVEGDPEIVIVFYKNELTLAETQYVYKNDFVSTFRFRDGLIVHLEERLDSIPLVEVMGGTVNQPAAN